MASVYLILSMNQIPRFFTDIISLPPHNNNMRYGYFWPYVMSEETEAVRLSGLPEVTVGESGEAGVQP